MLKLESCCKMFFMMLYIDTASMSSACCFFPTGTVVSRALPSSATVDVSRKDCNAFDMIVLRNLNTENS